MKILPVPSLGSGLLPLAATAVIACGAGFGLGRMTAPSGADSAKGDSGGVNSGDGAGAGTQERAVAGAIVDLYRKDTNQAMLLLQSSSISAQVQQAALARMTNRGPWWR
ncbi:MAG: hypothetical protein EBZ83_00975 [Verrucomicrobia bacterium]|nr:hypothetical protein [Verrucomicrobiota bacterium]